MCHFDIQIMCHFDIQIIFLSIYGHYVNMYIYI